MCLVSVPSSVSIFAAGSLEPGLLSLYLQRPSHWDQLGAHTHTCAQTQMHHALNYTFFICVNVGSIKYQLVRPQPATWASDKFESQLSDGLIITMPGEARCHTTQCSHPLYLPSCTVLYWPGGAVRSVPILCLCPPSPVIGKYDPTLHTSQQPVSSVSSHITPFYYRYTLLSYISRGQGYSVYPRFVTLDLHCPGGRLMSPHHGAMSCCLSAPGSQRQPPSVLISPSNTTPGP